MAKKKAGDGEDLQVAISSQGYNWKAAKTELSRMSSAEQKAHLGLQVDPDELRATENAIKAAQQLEMFKARIAAPASVDWRNNSGDWITSIKDQQSCGACVSFAVLATIEARLNIVCKNPNLDRDFSEAFLFYCGCGNCCGTGWNFAPALEFCKNTGICDESVFPYTPADQPCKQGITPTFKITNWTSVLSVPDRKNMLAGKGPMVAGMAVYQDFFSYAGGVYRHVSGGLAGYHAISCIGYDDTEQCWICKNSWGSGWGESGYFKIGYGEAQIDTSFAMYDVDVECAIKPEDECRKYVPALRKVLLMARAYPSLRHCLRYYVCRRGPRPLCSPRAIAVVRIVLHILQRCPQYREPFCRVIQ